VRFLVLILLIVLVASLFSYAVLNLEELVDVTLPWVTLRGVHQIYLVLTSLLAGALFMGILSVVDGSRLRLANRRLRRELERLDQTQADSFPALDGASPAEPEPPPAPRGPFRGGGPDPADRPRIPSPGRSSDGDDTPPYGI
jgi:hypothetical protein